MPNGLSDVICCKVAVCGKAAFEWAVLSAASQTTEVTRRLTYKTGLFRRRLCDHHLIPLLIPSFPSPPLFQHQAQRIRSSRIRTRARCAIASIVRHWPTPLSQFGAICMFCALLCLLSCFLPLILQISTITVCPPATTSGVVLPHGHPVREITTQ